MTTKTKKLSRQERIYEACKWVGAFKDDELGYYKRSFPTELQDYLQDGFDCPDATIAEIKAAVLKSGMRYYKPSWGDVDV